MSIYASALQRLKAASPDQRCLLTNRPFDDSGQVVIAHVVLRSFVRNEELMSRLEYNWQIQRGSLNLDTRKNMFYLEKELYKLYMKKEWMLIPTQDLLDQYMQDCSTSYSYYHVPNPRKTKVPGQYEYYVYPVTESMREYIVNRFEFPESTPEDPNPTSPPTPMQVPLISLPTLTSHIHPDFVILAARSRIQKIKGWQAFCLPHHSPFGHLMRISGDWLNRRMDQYCLLDYTYRARLKPVEEMELMKYLPRSLFCDSKSGDKDGNDEEDVEGSEGEGDGEQQVVSERIDDMSKGLEDKVVESQVANCDDASQPDSIDSECPDDGSKTPPHRILPTPESNEELDRLEEWLKDEPDILYRTLVYERWRARERKRIGPAAGYGHHIPGPPKSIRPVYQNVRNGQRPIPNERCVELDDWLLNPFLVGRGAV